jgi:hypothetical protein
VKHDRKKLHGRSRRRRENNIKINLKELQCQGMDWIDMTRERDNWRALVNTVMILWIPLSAGIISSGVLE